MLTEYELLKEMELCNQNPDFAYIIKRHNEENSRLLSSITHEIRNPLTLIQSTMQLMESRNSELSNIKYWTRVSEDIKNLTKILNDISLYGNCGKINRENINLYEILLSVKENFDTSETDKKISISVNMDAECKTTASSYQGDKIKLNSVFTNLIKNAIEAIDYEGKIDINIKALPKDNSLSIEFSNNGNKIPENYIDTIFEPYTTYKDGGTGMGLSICKKIIDSHNGIIYVSSTDDETKFTIILPLT